LPPLSRRIAALRGHSVDDVVASLHRIEPGPIRVGSDPVTYNLHILVRVELERALLDGRLAVNDLADAWNASYDAHLGVRPANDVEGVLQDGHWSAGMFGYFPTYAIGNVAAAQLMSAIRRSLPQLDDDISRGDTKSLRHWLAHHVWSRAGTATLDEILLDATGEPLSEHAFLAQLD
jgi:carboxypeptidase Taq